MRRVSDERFGEIYFRFGVLHNYECSVGASAMGIIY